MALSSTTAAAPRAEAAAASRKRPAVKSGSERGGNNDRLPVAPSPEPEPQRPQEVAQPASEHRPRSSQRRPGLDGPSSDEAAFVLDGERFYDAVGVDESVDAALGVSGGYWGLQVDDETQTPYYFNHLQPEELQWLPPAELIRPGTQEVTLWDPAAQWFYLYSPQTRTSRWLEDSTNGMQQQ